MPYDVTLDPPPSQVARPTPLLPELALLIYSRGSEHLLLKHPVEALPGGRCTLGAGVPLTPGDLDHLAAYLTGTGMRLTGSTTLAVGMNSVAWWVPPGARALLFDAKYAQTASIAALSGRAVPLPGLVMVATPGQLRVFAVRGAARPTASTPLMNAPFWNIFSSHAMCRGTVKYPSLCTPDTQEAWELAFFQSVFTGPSRQDKYMNWGRSYQELLEQALHDHAFPEDVLVEAKLTLADILTQ